MGLLREFQESEFICSIRMLAPTDFKADPIQ